MADQQLKDLTENTTPNDADILYLVVDPAGTPLDRKITWTTIKAFLKTYFDTLYPSGSGSSTGTNTGDQDATDFDIKNLTDSTNLRATWSGKQDALGFTPENVANKVTSFQATPDNTHYPSEKLVKDSLDGKQSTLSSTQKTILTTDWTDEEATISVSGITTTSIVFVSPDSTSYDDYTSAEIRATGLGSGTITFACTEEPTEDVIINLVF